MHSLFFPPKEVRTAAQGHAALTRHRLQDHAAFQTYFTRRNTVPVDGDGAVFAEYQAKLLAMLRSLASREVAPQNISLQHFESWLDVPPASVPGYNMELLRAKPKPKANNTNGNDQARRARDARALWAIEQRRLIRSFAA